MPAAGYSAVVDRDGVSPELRNDIEELARRRADIAVGWATVEAQNRRRGRVYGLAGTAWVAGLAIAVTAAGVVPVYLSKRGVLAEHTLDWLVPVGMLGTMAVCGIGRPSGRRNKATIANQSAQAPTMPASANART